MLGMLKVGRDFVLYIFNILNVLSDYLVVTHHGNRT